MELLNLDSLVRTQRTVELGGKTYAVAEQTIGMLLDAIKAQKLTEEDGNEMLFQLFRSAKRILPDAADEVIEGMNIDQLTALIEFGVASSKQMIEDAETEEQEVDEGK